MLAKGKYRARAIEWSQVTEHAKTGTEEIRVLFQVTDEGEFNGHHITWRGYFSEQTAERTIESLRYLGWSGDDVTNIQGLDANEVQIVVEHEEYQGKTQVKIAWVNRLASVYVGQPMSDAKKMAFKDRMKGLVMATRQTSGAARQPAPGGPRPPANAGRQPPPAGSGGDFPFGANAPEAREPVKLG